MRSEDPTWPRRGAVLAGKFLVGEALGEGGMAVVVAAIDRTTSRRVALKLPRPERRRPRDLERFEREARAIAALASPHLPRVYETGTLRDGDRDLPYIALEHLDGIDLATLLAARTLGHAAAAEIIGQACRALAVAHEAGIVHRDLKPANMFLTASEGRVIVKLLDFGICRTREPSNATTTGTLLGSPAYMPPERMRPSATVDTHGDQWSLGIVLYEIVAGRRPFDAPGFPDLCLQILLDDVPPLDAPDTIVRIVRRCLDKEPAARFPDVTALAASLAPLAQPIMPAEIGIASPQPIARRRPLARVAVALGATAAIAFAIDHARRESEPTSNPSVSSQPRATESMPIDSATRFEPAHPSRVEAEAAHADRARNGLPIDGGHRRALLIESGASRIDAAPPAAAPKLTPIEAIAEPARAAGRPNPVTQQSTPPAGPITDPTPTAAPSIPVEPPPHTDPLASPF